MKKSEAFPSKYFRADDFPNPLTLTIASATWETLKNPKGEQQQKVVLGFKKTRKLLPLNVTNFDSVVDATGEADSDDFPGHQIQLYASEVQVGSEMKPCVRVRAPEQAELKPAKNKSAAKADADADADDMNDPIPFA